MLRMMKMAGHKQTTLCELDGFDHGEMAEPAFDLLLKIIRNQLFSNLPTCFFINSINDNRLIGFEI